MEQLGKMKSTNSPSSGMTPTTAAPSRPSMTTGASVSAAASMRPLGGMSAGATPVSMMNHNASSALDSMHPHGGHASVSAASLLAAKAATTAAPQHASPVSQSAAFYQQLHSTLLPQRPNPYLMPRGTIPNPGAGGSSGDGSVSRRK